MTARRTMTLDDIYHYFQAPPPIYLSREQAVCYILSVLLQGDSYGSRLVKHLTTEYPAYGLSETVLYGALQFLEEQGTIAAYWQRVKGRGRPRRMYQIQDAARRQAEELAGLWQRYLQRYGTAVGNSEM